MSAQPYNTHIFHYRWRRIKEGLTYKGDSFFGPLSVEAPEGAYIYHQGTWYEKRKPPGGGARTVTVQIKPEHVPREIRTLALLVT